MKTVLFSLTLVLISLVGFSQEKLENLINQTETDKIITVNKYDGVELSVTLEPKFFRLSETEVNDRVRKQMVAFLFHTLYFTYVDTLELEIKPRMIDHVNRTNTQPGHLQSRWKWTRSELSDFLNSQGEIHGLFNKTEDMPNEKYFKLFDTDRWNWVQAQVLCAKYKL